MSPRNVIDSARTIQKELTINAPVEAVWKALTDAEELIRWFPLEARVKPGAGGSIWQAWRDYEEGELPIEIWEPNKHLRLIWPQTVAGGALAKQEGEPGTGAVLGPLAVDFHLQGRGGSTVVRLVHSGFSSDTIWDETYDGIRRGWNYEIRGLRHYLEHHRGVPRLVAWARTTLAIPLTEAWQRLTGRDGLLREGSLAGKKEGDRYAITTAAGHGLEGTVYILDPPKDFCGTVDNMNRSLFRIHNDKSCGGEDVLEANLWLSCYGISSQEVQDFEKRYGALLRRLYPEASAS